MIIKNSSTSIAFWISLFLAGALWISDSLLDFLWFNETGTSFLSTLLPFYDSHELILRFTYTTTLLFCGLVVSWVLTQMTAGQKETSKLRNYLQNIIDSMPSMLIGLDSDCKVTLWNLEAQKFTGIPAAEVLGTDIGVVFPEAELARDRIIESIRNREPYSERKKLFKTADGNAYRDITIYPLIADGIEGVVLSVTDVTEQVRLEEMMVQSEKMLSVGGLAAGMAHEINNPLAGIMQTANVMAGRLNPESDLPVNREAAEEAGTTMKAIGSYMENRGIFRMIENILQSGVRLSEIVNNMLSFARKTGDRKSTHDIVQLIEKTIELAATDYDLKKDYDFRQIKIVKEYDANVPPVSCERGKIQQVLLNIFRNGSEAMHQADTAEPTFHIRTRLDADYGFSCIEIGNNGPGLTEEVRNRIFEPFFTTKPVGMGTGLGMSVSYFIIKNEHGGDISVDSNPEGGVRFTVSLPVEWTESQEIETDSI